jgi:hypothetical protein
MHENQPQMTLKWRFRKIKTMFENSENSVSSVVIDNMEPRKRRMTRKWRDRGDENHV